MNIKQKNVISCIMTVSLIVLFLNHSAAILEEKSSIEKYGSFFEEKENFDVLFMGSSHVKYGIFPMELWHNYGIVSYNLGVSWQLLPATYWQMMNVLDYVTPKLMVIDCFALSSTQKGTEHTHIMLDEIPLSKTKVNAIFDLLNDNAGTHLTHMEFLWNYFLYHNRWNELGKSDFEPINTYEKGATYCNEIEVGNEMREIPRESKLEEETVAIEYLKKIIEECQSREIDVLLMYLPFPAEENGQKEANSVYDIANQYGVNYINFLNMDIVNYKTDCFDPTHLNLSGGRKVTDYVGQYIIKHYDVADQRNNKVFDSWNSDYEYYRSEMITEFRSYESLDYYLLFLYNKDYLTFIEVNDSEIWHDEYYVSLFENLGVNRECVKKDVGLLMIQSAAKRVAYLESLWESDLDIMTELGEVQISVSESGDYSVYMDNKEIFREESADNSKADVSIFVIDKNTEEVVDRSCFSRKKDNLRIYKKN